MTYTDAFLDRKGDKFHIAERINGKRHIKTIPAEYIFYYEHSAGTRKSIFGHPVKKVTATSSQKFRTELRNHSQDRTFETDTNPLFQYLSTAYAGVDAPVLNIGFFDIEADFDPVKKWAPSNNPFNAITAITLYRSQDKKLLSFILRPPTVSQAEAKQIESEFKDTWIYDDEKDLLRAFIAEIEDVDILTGWNSSDYDIPYTINRIALLLGKEETKKFCLFNQFPSEREYKNKFGRTVKTYDLTGRVHLDYLELYRKHNPQQRLSYALNSIGQLVVKESKVQFSGSLDELYKNEFRKFIDYNQQDVMLMVKIDAKLKYIELHNQVAHANSVILKTTMGSVALVEQAILNEMHAMGFVAPNRKKEIDEDKIESVGYLIDEDEEDDFNPYAKAEEEDDGRTPVVGAYVAHPKVGLHTYIGAVDINSLYPSAIRALNMSPETLVGQVRMDATLQFIKERASKLPKVKKAEAWEDIFSILEFTQMHEKGQTLIEVDFFDLIKDTVKTVQMTGEQLYDYIFDPKNHVCITANGTIFRTDVDGIIPQLLSKWYAERKDMQKKQKEWKEKKATATTQADKDEAEYWESFWDQRQQARKILLNSLYGALLNEALRFYDERLGQSVTLTGRTIDKHMTATVNEKILGVYDYKGDAIIYADTDSCYFSAYEVLKDRPEYADFEWSKENIIALYDMIAEETNDTFGEFMVKTFNTSLPRGQIIRAGRELIASKGLFIKKKKYAVLMFDKEGMRLDKDGSPGELKVMGLDLKRADTPKYMQEFLEKLLLDLLSGVDISDIYDNIKQFRILFKERPGWEKGSPKNVSDLTKYINQQKAIDAKLGTLGKGSRVKRDDKLTVNMPGHVRASMNWNTLCQVNDSTALPITDGTRIIVCKLTKNSYNMTSVAYPIDEPHLPEWFKDLPFNHKEMENTIIDNKINNVVGVLNWDLTDTIDKPGDEFFS